MSLTYNIKSTISFAQIAGAFAMGISQFDQKKYQTIEEIYKKALKDPQSYLDYLLLSRSPDSIINIELNNFITNEELEEIAIEKLCIHLTQQAIKEKEREKEAFLEELRLDDIKTKQKDLDKALQPTLQTAKQVDSPDVARLRIDLNELQTEAGQLAGDYYRLTQQENNITQRWNNTYREHGEEFVADLESYSKDHPLKLPNGKVIELTPEKKEELVEANIPAPPPFIAKIATARQQSVGEGKAEDFVEAPCNLNHALCRLKQIGKLCGHEKFEVLSPKVVVAIDKWLKLASKKSNDVDAAKSAVREALECKLKKKEKASRFLEVVEQALSKKTELDQLLGQKKRNTLTQ